MKLQTRDLWMFADACGERFSREGIHLLVGSIDVEFKFQTGVFGTEVSLNEDKS